MMDQKALALIDLITQAMVEREREAKASEQKANYRDPFRTGSDPLPMFPAGWTAPEQRTPEFIDHLSDYRGGYTDMQPFAPSGSPRREIKPK